MRESESEKPIPWRIIVMKNPMAYAGTVEAKNMNAIIRHAQLVLSTRKEAMPYQRARGQDPPNVSTIFARSFYQGWSLLCRPPLGPGSSAKLNILEADFVFHQMTRLALFFVEEFAFVGEIRNKKPGKNTKCDSEGTLYEENPLPTIETSLSLKLGESKG